MRCIHKQLPIAVHTWDWKEQPNWHFINSVISNFIGRYGHGIWIEEIETGADEYAIVISKTELGSDEAMAYYRDAGDDENWKDV